MEDDAAVRRSLQLLFTAEGYDVRAYGSGTGLPSDEEALKADCLVADLILPGTNAIQLLAGLRQAGWEGSAVLFSGQLNETWRSEARNVGFNAIFEKPLPTGALLHAVGRLLHAD